MNESHQKEELQRGSGKGDLGGGVVTRDRDTGIRVGQNRGLQLESEGGWQLRDFPDHATLRERVEPVA